jgi:hypothetical protein
MSTTMLLVIVILIASIVGVGAFLFLRSRKPAEGVTLYLRCPSCRSKMRYSARQVGHQGMCTSRKHRFTFPAVDSAHR